MNRSGKALTFFLVVIAILLVALTTIAVFFFLKEVELRQVAEELSSKIQAENKELKKQVFVLEEKNKELTEEKEDMAEDLELEQGLREELKKLNTELQESVAAEKKAREETATKLTTEIAEAEKKIASLQERLDLTTEKNKTLEEAQAKLEEEKQKLTEQLESLMGGIDQDVVPEGEPAAAVGEPEGMNVDLQKIVVKPSSDSAGKVIVVDTETNFVIVNLGQKDGITKDTILSLYRGDDYLGDVKVTRALPEMSAADLIPPLSSQDVAKDDQAVIKVAK